MSDTTMREIVPASRIDAQVNLPPSKSYTNRALVVAALAEGTSTLHNTSQSDDSMFLISALRDFGIPIAIEGTRLNVEGCGGSLRAPGKEIFVGNAGTAMRFLTSFATIAQGETVITGDEQMKQRPINDLLEALRASGIKCTSENGYPPVRIHGGSFNGKYVDIKASVSSQFVSSILLTAPYARHPVTLHVRGKLSSLPYVDMSIEIMRAFGATVNFFAPSTYEVGNMEKYIGREFEIEGDASSATYFLAAAAITGGRVHINNLPSESLQGDLRFVNILEEMGCRVVRHERGIELHGRKLLGIEVDMNELPDCVPTLAVIAAFAEGQTTISNVAHLQFKETNRLKAIALELGKLGAKVEAEEDCLIIHPRPLKGAVIETYNDHRIAMSFAVAGLRVPGVVISNPACVSKSFPAFWEEFRKLEYQA